jgi:hypothetical protein
MDTTGDSSGILDCGAIISNGVVELAVRCDAGLIIGGA